MANLTVLNFLPHLGDGQCQGFRDYFILLQKMKSQAKGCFFADARKTGDFRHSIFDQFGGEVQVMTGLKDGGLNP
jgi:hypothetical protein